MKEKRVELFNNIKNFLLLELGFLLLICIAAYLCRLDLKKSIITNSIFICINFVNIFLFNSYDEFHKKVNWKGAIFMCLTAIQLGCQCIFITNYDICKIFICICVFFLCICIGSTYYIRKIHNKITKFEKMTILIIGSILLVLGYVQKSMGSVLTGRLLKKIGISSNYIIFFWIFFLIFESMFAILGGLLIASDWIEYKKIKHR